MASLYCHHCRLRALDDSYAKRAYYCNGCGNFNSLGLLNGNKCSYRDAKNSNNYCDNVFNEERPLVKYFLCGRCNKFVREE